MRNMDWKRLLWGAGRTRRRAYWITMIGLIAAGWLGHAAGVAAAAAMPGLVGSMAGPMLILDVVVAWMTVCLCSRRLHDTGRSGWWQAPPSVAVVVCFAVAEPALAIGLGLDEAAAGWTGLAGLTLYVAMLTTIGLLRPTPGRNRFDDAPAAA
jgi:uncharacterized membrane protein YhaH (DUF805 family)